MRRFFTVLFLVSVVATAGVYYWRTYQPEATIVAAAPAPEAEADDGGRAERRSLSPEALSAPSSPVAMKEPSDRQDMAMMISLVSSVISALAAIFQTWLTSRAVRSRA